MRENVRRMHGYQKRTGKRVCGPLHSLQPSPPICQPSPPTRPRMKQSSEHPAPSVYALTMLTLPTLSTTRAQPHPSKSLAQLTHHQPTHFMIKPLTCKVISPSTSYIYSPGDSNIKSVTYSTTQPLIPHSITLIHYITRSLTHSQNAYFQDGRNLLIDVMQTSYNHRSQRSIFFCFLNDIQSHLLDLF